MKRLISLALVIVMLFTLFGCVRTYQPVESTEREKTTVMTFNINGAKYDMPYEVYRAFFLNYKSQVTGGDDSLWQGEDKDTYIDKINGIIIDLALDIYSTFELCRTVGIDVYSTDFGKRINDYINESIEESESYEEYLAYLKKINLNYSMQSLLFRYALALAELEKYYIGATSVEEIESGFWVGGALKYTDEDIKAFYDSEDCAKILRLHLQAEAYVDPMARANEIKKMIENASSENDVINIMGGSSLTGGPEVENGYVIGRYNLDSNIHRALIDASFGISEGEVADPIVIHDGDEYIYYVVYRAEKSDEHFNKNKTEVTYVYLWNELGKMLDSTEDSMKNGVEFKDFLDTLDYSKISMDEESRAS